MANNLKKQDAYFDEIKRDIYKKIGGVWVKQDAYVVRESREPIAYSYNGTVLPPLPEWDKEVYPYAYITYKSSLFRLLTLSKKKHAYSVTSCLFSSEIDTWLVWELQDGTWEAINPYMNIAPVIWSNTDIYYKDNVEDVGGTIYLTASEPIPIYE